MNFANSVHSVQDPFWAKMFPIAILASLDVVNPFGA